MHVHEVIKYQIKVWTQIFNGKSAKEREPMVVFLTEISMVYIRHCLDIDMNMNMHYTVKF